MPPWYYKMDAAGRLTGLFKPGGGVRPISAGNRERCSIARMIAREFNDIATELMAPVQCGGTRDGPALFAMAVRQLVEERPEWPSESPGDVACAVTPDVAVPEEEEDAVLKRVKDLMRAKVADGRLVRRDALDDGAVVQKPA